MKLKDKIILPLILLFLGVNNLFAEVKRLDFPSNGQYMILEILDDDLIHIELSATGSNPGREEPIHTSPMIDKIDYSGPSTYSKNENVIETKELQASVDTQNLCISFKDMVKDAALCTICPQDLSQAWKGLTLTKEKMENVYGLGQRFKKLGSADGDWISHGIREEQPQGQEQYHGNGFMPFGQAGMVGNVQFPIMYAVGSNHLNYALFLDNVYKQRWDFTSDPWKVQMWGDQVRFYIMSGKDLPDLRSDYLELVGAPPVPPKKAFGLWVSEFGYKNWLQIDDLRSSLRNDNFPIDGFVLDLQWFGGIIPNNPNSAMGKLNWDQNKDDGNDFYFPDPEQKIAYFAKDNIGFVTIEESYINQNTDTYAQMQSSSNLLAYSRTNNKCDASNQADSVVLDNWFGKAGMVDWSDTEAGKWIHANRRFPNLVQKGVLGHWTDLGEPEKYDSSACYEGVETTDAGIKNQHGDIHNIYNFLWNKSIYDGYVSTNDQVNRRPFIVTRSGAPGTQRFGVAMWSGDIGSNLDILASHLNAQLHMSFSGIDYYGSDIGGFRREGIPYNGNHSGNLQYEDELYTQSFANGAWFDVPVRPHTDNSFQTNKRYETSPNLVGNKKTNLANLRQRYELIPYYYSLAYRAYLFSEPVISPLVFYYQDDNEVRQIGHEKLIGKDILVGVVAKHGEYKRDIYLPKGKWINYHTSEWFKSSGEWIKDYPTYIDGILRLPSFVKAGAIIPKMHVDELTEDTYGHRKDGSTGEDLIVRVYADPTKTEFSLFEDDGATISFDSNKKPIYQTRTTSISQVKKENVVTVIIDKANGTFPKAVTQRNNLVELVVEDAQATGVTFNGTNLVSYTSKDTFESAASGWYNAGSNLIVAKSGINDVNTKKTFEFLLKTVPSTASAYFVCNNGWTNLGEEIFIVGNIPALGSWDENKGVKLNPSVYYEYIYNPPPNHNGPGPNTPKWTAHVGGLPTNTSIEWKLVKKLNTGQWQKEPGDKHKLITSGSGFAGTYTESF